MVKLVATDMDGTLLDSGKKLPEEFFRIVEALPEVKFVIASGRQYYNILKECAPVQDRISVIAENGAVIAEEKTVLSTETMDAPVALTVAKKAVTLPETCFILCGEQAAHIVGDASEQMLYKAHSYYERVERTDDFEAVLRRDRILKIAVYRHKRAEDFLFPSFSYLNALDLGVKAVLSGQSWVDIMCRNVNKGWALQKLQARYGILPEECMAFGDYLNDTEMLSVCGESYAMANAHPELIGLAKHIAPSNDENGVVSVLKEKFFLPDETVTKG